MTPAALSRGMGQGLGYSPDHTWLGRTLWEPPLTRLPQLIVPADGRHQPTTSARKELATAVLLGELPRRRPWQGWQKW